jgi:DNA-binding MarR family transcriptional regulator
MPESTPSYAAAASELRIIIGQLVRRLRTEHRLPISHGAVLGRLERGGPNTTSALAAAERIRPQSMASTIAELESQGFVTRVPDPDDGRQMLIEVAPKGREMLEEERRRRDGWLAEAIRTTLTADEQKLLIEAVALLRRLAESDATTAAGEASVRGR